MRKPLRNNIADARMLTLDQACTVTGMGRNRCREWCDRNGATRKFGSRMVRYDKVVINQALDRMSQAAVNTETA